MVNFFFSTSFFLTASLAVVATLIWWLKRKKVLHSWLPILAVFPHKRQKILKIIWEKPPLVPFVVFLLLAATWILLSLHPERSVPTQVNREREDVYLLADLSPSMEAWIGSEASLQDWVFGWLEQEKNYIQQVFVFDDSSNAWVGIGVVDEVLSNRDLLIPYLTFKRYGLKFSASFLRHLFDDPDKKWIVFRDTDQHSWPAREADRSLYFSVPHPQMGGGDSQKVVEYNRQNFYVDRIEPLASESRSQRDLNLRVLIKSRAVQTNEASFKVKVEQVKGDLGVYEAEWVFQKNQREQYFDISIPGFWLTKSEAFYNLRFAMSVAGDGGMDAVLSDNLFYFNVSKSFYNVALIARDRFEKWMEDPVYYLRQAMMALQFSTARFSSGAFIDKKNESLVSDLDALFVVDDGIQPLMRVESLPKKPLFWMREFEDVKADTMCKRLSQSLGEGSAFVETCVLAWVNQRVGAVVSLTSKGDRPVFIFYASLERLIRERLLFVRLLSEGFFAVFPKRSLSTVLRIEDFFALDEQMRASLKDATINIPEEESLLRFDQGLQSGRNAPLNWQGQSADGQQPSQKEFILIANILAISLLLFESVWRLFKSLRPVLLLFLCLGAVMTPKVGLAQSGVQRDLSIVWGEDVLKDTDGGYKSFRRLFLEVEKRTSLSFSGDRTLLSGRNVDGNPQNAASPLHLAGVYWGGIPSSKEQQSKLRDWLLRGGVWFLETRSIARTSEDLSRFFIQGGRSLPLLSAISMDSEFVRSFYRLQTFPVCDSQEVWHELRTEGRAAVVAIPFCLSCYLNDAAFLTGLTGQSSKSCSSDLEAKIRMFVNMMMVALTTDYKIEQMTIPDVLKRFDLQ